VLPRDVAINITLYFIKTTEAHASISSTVN